MSAPVATSRNVLMSAAARASASGPKVHPRENAQSKSSGQDAFMESQLGSRIFIMDEVRATSRGTGA